MSEEEDIEAIELYILKKLDVAERAIVEARLKTDTSYAQHFHDIRVVMEGVKEVSRQELKEELRALEEKLSRKEKGGKGVVWWIGVAASLLIAVVFVMVFRKDQSAPPLYLAYYKPYPNVSMPSERGENERSARAEAFQFYERGDYAAATQRFEAIEPKDMAAYFYLASAYMANEQIDKATTNFEKCLTSENVFTVPARWYLALCYVYKDDKERSQELLKAIVSHNDAYSTKAADLLREINSGK
jgi:tetratricopeptide (TPR) repeat protein